MKIIHIQAKQTTKIIGKFSNSIPTTYRFTAASVPINKQPSGTIKVKGSNWIFSKPATTQPLKAENTVSKTMWDTFYSVYVTPDHDVNITLEIGKLKSPMVFIALALGITVIAASFLIIALK